MYTRAVSRTWGRRPHAACAPWSRRRARGTRHAMTTALHSRPFQCGCGAVHDSLNKDVTARVGVQCGPFLENKRTGKRKSKRYATREVNSFVLALVFLSKLPSAKSTRLVLARSARLVYSLQGTRARARLPGTRKHAPPLSAIGAAVGARTASASMSKMRRRVGISIHVE